MSTQTGPAARGRLQATIFKMINVPMRALLALPVRTPLSGRLMLLYFTGRKTGKRYRQPISYIRDSGTMLTPGGGRWTRNLRDGEPVRIRLGGRDLTVRPELARDPDLVDRLLSVMTAANPSVAKFMPLPRDAEGKLDRAALENAIAHGFCIVRWRPDTASSPTG
jgi:hypothetical protein